MSYEIKTLSAEEVDVIEQEYALVDREVGEGVDPCFIVDSLIATIRGLQESNSALLAKITRVREERDAFSMLMRGEKDAKD